MVIISLENDNRIPLPALEILKDRYMAPNETSPQEAFARAASAFSGDDEELAQRIYDYVSKGWMMFSTPILSNGGTKRGLPIACFGGYVPDSRGGITDHYTENAWLSSMGGGIGGYWGDIRSDSTPTSKGSKSTGSIPFIKVVDSQMLAFSQGSSRRGSYAAYMDISHPEIEEFIGIRKPSGDHNRKSLNLHHAVVIPDSFMEAVQTGDEWNLIDPHSKKIVKTVDARSLWISIINTRVETGEPYIMWKDTCNDSMPEALKTQGLEIKQSNLCCVSGDTKIKMQTNNISGDAFVEIGHVIGQKIRVWNGFEYTTVIPYFAGFTDEWIVVTTENGKVKVTPNHRFILSDESEVLAENLTKEHILIDNGAVNKILNIEHIRLLVREKSYCYTDPIRGYGFFNGVITGNSEIILPTNEERTFVCCLSSVNLEYYEEWKTTNIVRDVVRFLDNVLTFFIENAPDEISKAKYSAMMSRDIGLGAMGFHSFLQRKNIPFESVMAKVWNKKIFQFIKEEAIKETNLLAIERGKAPDSPEINPVRNMHLLAIAPNASSSIICGCSPSIEPYAANYYKQNTLSGSFEMKNPYLVELLERHGRNDIDTWKTISTHEGSVQGLDFLSQEEKDIFKTSNEIDQRWIIEHAADRQPYICQAQSVNLFFTPDENGEIDASYLHHVHFSAWKKKLKTLYYLRSKSLRRTEKVNIKVERKTLLGSQNGYEETSCISCEG